MIGVCHIPSGRRPAARWHPYSPESLGIPRVSASSCSHRVPDRDHAIIHMPRGRGFSHPWDLFSSNSGGRTPQLGHLFSRRSVVPRNVGILFLPLMPSAGHDWNPFVPIVLPVGRTLYSLMKRHLPYE